MEHITVSKALAGLTQAQMVEAPKNGSQLPANGRSISVAIDKTTGREIPVVRLATGGQGDLNPWVAYGLVNGNAGGGTVQVHVGSLTGIAGNAAWIGLAANASSDAAVTATDSNGVAVASVGPLQFLSHLSVAKNIVVDEIVLDGAEATVNAIVIRQRTIHIDGTFAQDKSIPFAQFERREDQNVTVWRIKGPFLLSELSYLQFSLTNGAPYTLRLKMPYWVGAHQFVQM